ncbi:MAG: hemolysin family protein [Pseudomonadota bacterium]
MAPFPWLDLVIILVLVLLNGVFAMSELAIVSARTARLAALAEKGNRGARTAMALAANPGRFLSTVQVGITLIGIIAGAYSGASLGGPVAERLARAGVAADLSQTLGFALVIGFTTYASLVIGELVPKQIALRSAERIAVVMAIPMDLLARIAAPLVWVLDMTSALIFRLLGLRRTADDLVTAEELQMVFAEATKSGVIEEQERAIISGVVRLADRPVREVMTPRTEVDWIDVDADVTAIAELLERSQHSLWPVAEGSIDVIIGVVKVRELLLAMTRGDTPDIRALMLEPAIIPDQVDAMDALGVLQQADVTMAMVHDEYGHFEGLVTPADVLSALAGNFVSDSEDGALPRIIEREDGSLLVSGALPADMLADRIGLRFDEDRDFATVAGYALAILRHLPQEGEAFADQGWRFEIVDMDGRKIDKLIARPLSSGEETA